jgi:hypothetical protein
MMVVVSDVHLGSDVGRKCRGTGRACDDLDLDPLFKTIIRSSRQSWTTLAKRTSIRKRTG